MTIFCWNFLLLFIYFTTEELEFMTARRLPWSRGSVLAFSTQVRGFKPGRSLRIFKGGKILSAPSFRGEVKPSVPCRRFAACKRNLNGVEVVICAKSQFPLPPLGSLTSWRTWRHLVVEVGTSKRGGKQWQTTPKNLPRMQRTRTIPVAWLNSVQTGPRLNTNNNKNNNMAR